MPGGSGQPGPAVCRACGYRLNPQTLYEGDVLVEVSWLHGYEADHDPDPQPVQALPVSAMVCDFCGLPGPVWSIDTDRDILIREVRDTARGPLPMTSEVENAWAACDPCARLVTTGRHGELRRRVLATAPGPVTPVQAERLRVLHEAFFAAGPRRPTRLHGGPQVAEALAPGTAAGAVADYLVGQVAAQRRRMATALPETNVVFKELTAAALADRPPHLPAGLLDSLMARPHGPALVHETLTLATLAGATGLWRRTRVAYSVDADLWAQLGDLDGHFRLPLSVLGRLPHPNPFLAFPEPLHLPLGDGEHRRIVGAFITGEHATTDPATDEQAGDLLRDHLCGTHSNTVNALKLTLCGLVHTDDGTPVTVADGSTDIAFTRLALPTHGEHTLTDLVDYALARMGPSPELAGSERTDVTAMLRRALSLLVYLCSVNADLHERPVQRPRSSKKTKRDAQRRRAPAQVVEVGYRIGATLRAHARQRAEPDGTRTSDTDGPRTVAPHIRRLHPHWYRVGPGRQQLELKWLDPIHVNMRGPAGHTTVIPVRADQTDPPNPVTPT